MLGVRNVHAISFAVTFTVAALGSPANAQLDSLPPPPPPPYHAPIPPPPPPPEDRASAPAHEPEHDHPHPHVHHHEPEEEPRSYEPSDRYLDANTDRVILFPTGETHPKGTLFLSDYELAGIEGGYAFTNDLQLQLTGLLPLKHEPHFIDAGFKLNLARAGSLRLALAAGGVLAEDRRGESFDGARAGLALQICFETACRSSMSFDAGTLVSNRASSYLPVYASAGAIVALTSTVKLLLEPAYGIVSENGLDAPKGFVMGYGVRFADRLWAIDLAMVKPTGSGSPSTILPIGSPFVALTLRSPH